MKKLLLLLLVASMADASAVAFFQLGDVIIKFDEVDGYLVNSACKVKNCEALTKARAFKNQKVAPELLEGGKNPSSVKCSKLMGGKVVIAKDTDGNQQSLCWFKDDSYLQ